jgi:hypothetical protein
MTQLILKREPIGSNSEDYSVLEDGAVIGRIFFLDAVGPQGRPWMWASGHNGDYRRAAHGYEPTRSPGVGGGSRRSRKQIARSAFL